jgi:hypothetical protein
MQRAPGNVAFIRYGAVLAGAIGIGVVGIAGMPYFVQPPMISASPAPVAALVAAPVPLPLPDWITSAQIAAPKTPLAPAPNQTTDMSAAEREPRAAAAPAKEKKATAKTATPPKERVATSQRRARPDVRRPSQSVREDFARATEDTPAPPPRRRADDPL